MIWSYKNEDANRTNSGEYRRITYLSTSSFFLFAYIQIPILRSLSSLLSATLFPRSPDMGRSSRTPLCGMR